MQGKNYVMVELLKRLYCANSFKSGLHCMNGLLEH